MNPLRRANVVVAALAMLAVSTACDSVPKNSAASPTTSVTESTTSDGYVVPDLLRGATMVWSSDPGVDLLSTEGTLARASEESYAITLLLGLDYAYPGFAQSSNSRGGGGILGGRYQDDTGDGPFVGTVHGHIQQIIPIDGGFDVLSCVLAVGLDQQLDGKFIPSRLTGGEGAEQRARFTRTGDPTSVKVETPAPPSPDLLHWQAPLDDQFVGWQIEGFIDHDPATSGRGRCASWARSLYPDAPVDIPQDAYANDDPPPVEPAYPGWSDGAN